MNRLLATALLTLTALPLSAHVWDEMAILARPNDSGTWDLDRYCFIQPTTYTNAVFMDYNNDGHLDLLVMGSGGDWNFPASQKFLLLYRNLGPEEDYRFEKVTDTGLPQSCDEGYYNPVSTGDFNHDGYTDVAVMTWNNGRNVEIYLNESGSGRFSPMGLPLEGATNGSVMLADIDNDGWLDLEYSGYSDRSATALKLYRNNTDGTVTDISEAEVTGAFQGQSTVADLNGDGLLDIISCGNGDNRVRLSSIYLQKPEGGWRYVAESESGITGASRANPLAADLNADGIVDLVVNGEGADGSGYRTRIYYGTPDGSYSLDSSFPVVGINQDGGINLADWNHDGNMDLIVGGYLGTNDGDIPRYSSPLRVYENIPEAAGIAGNTRPLSPASVTAEADGDMITISWLPGDDAETAQEALRYNLLVRNDTSGEVYTLIPSDPLLGFLKVGTDLQTSLSSKVTEYTMSSFGPGEYTIGVQTLDQAYAGSPFTICNLTVEDTGVKDMGAEPGFTVTRTSDGILVEAPEDASVTIFTASGVKVYDGEPGLLPLSKGIYLIGVATPGNAATVKMLL